MRSHWELEMQVRVRVVPFVFKPQTFTILEDWKQLEEIRMAAEDQAEVVE